ncbi:diacylglycerol kinase family protein [Microbacterium sp. Marseille-Q6648]|uniref:diacylglycerol/lipid kinase family protein n=1 Tax=Microbacterium sp. Marseille-Q6648 TaxID=2937991 RepID=UPI00203A9A64|nr:diacylglycerol kinase family protein [Microbacterium sp. Marseille-Q6648]
MPTPADDRARPADPERGRGLLVVRNARSGADVIRFGGEDLGDRLPGARVHELGPSEDMADAVDAAMRTDPAPTVLGVYGGDGSVARMADLARAHGLPLLVLPGGTFNHFARTAGMEDVGAALDAFEAGTTRHVSAVEVAAGDDAPRLALNAVSVGVYPELIDERDRRRAHLGKWLGGIVAAWRSMRTAEPIEIVRDGRRARVWSVFVGVGRNDPRRVASMQRESLEEATLDVRIHHARGSRLRAIAALAFGRRTAAVLRVLRLMPPRSDVERLVVSTFQMTVRPGPGHPSLYVHDGELEPQNGDFALRCTAIPHAVTVFAPEPVNG